MIKTVANLAESQRNRGDSSLTAGLLAFVVVGLVVSRLAAAVLSDVTINAYAAYVGRARLSFLERTNQPVGDGEAARASLRLGQTLVQPGAGDGIQTMPGGLIHHWRGMVFIHGVTLDQAVRISRAYRDYPTIFRPVTAATVLSGDGDTLRVQFRMSRSVGGITGTLDVWSDIRFVKIDAKRAYVLSNSETIREVKDAGKSTERYLSADQESGYLWRASAFTRFVEGDGGVYMEMETIGLSRPFPPLLRWVIEPFARRIGRASVEESVQEFRRAVERRYSPTG